MVVQEWGGVRGVGMTDYGAWGLAMPSRAREVIGGPRHPPPHLFKLGNGKT